MDKAFIISLFCTNQGDNELDTHRCPKKAKNIGNLESNQSTELLVTYFSFVITSTFIYQFTLEILKPQSIQFLKHKIANRIES